MVLIPSVLVGYYGDGTIGLKTSIKPYDVRVLADDNSSERRSFNSQWPNIAKIKIIGVAVAQPRAYQSQTGGVGSYRASNSGWTFDTPVQVPTGLTHMPIWEERLYNPVTRTFYDDKVIPSIGTYVSSFVGLRSYFPGPGASPANTVLFMPYANSGQPTNVVNSNYSEPSQPWPPYPDYPARPADQHSAYVIYSNKLGDVS